MVAAAYKANITIQYGNGMIESYYATCSDVAAAKFVFQDGSSDLTLPSNRGIGMIKDVILSAAGTDTSTSEVFVNNKNTGVKIINSANLGTVFNRQFMSSPMAITPGGRINFVQTA